jgi:putative transposase
MKPEVFYHIYNRGNNKQNIFFEEKNYAFFLAQLSKYIVPIADIYAYCLMPNHFHLLVRIKYFDKNDNTGLSIPEKAFRDFFISYAKAINKMYDRTGSLFQYKFKRKEIKRDSYFSWLFHYIHLNPVKAKLADNLHSWKWTSYKALLSEKETNIKREEVLEWFGSKQLFIDFHLNNIDKNAYRILENWD